MTPFQKLGLLGLLINGLGKDGLSQENNPQFFSFLEAEGMLPLAPGNLSLQLNHVISVIGSHFEYYDSCEMRTNEPLERYLIELSNSVANGDYPRTRDVAMMICSYGNKAGEVDCKDGVDALISMARGILDKYEDLDGTELPEQADEIYKADGHRLGYLNRVLENVDIFVTARFGMVAGVEEYAPLDYNTVHPLESFDIVTGTECGGDESCKCGCKVEHSLQMFQGMEDYLSGKTYTPAYYYYEGVSKAKGLTLYSISGSEGPVWDAVKNLGRAALDALSEAWKSIKELFDFDSDDENEVVTNVADDNKKALQSMEDKGAVINDKAKAGINEMAKVVDPSGEMGKIVADLETPANAPAVIDKLVGLLGTQSAGYKALTDERDEAQKALDDLKKTTESTTGDDSNKEAANAAKDVMKEKIAKAREALNNAKKAAQGHRKKMKGIRKAIRGISPHIFIVKVTKKNKDEGEKK